jgi:hypothetical protein
MKWFPEAWWLARPPLLRKVLKGALTLLALYCAFEFFGFSFQTSGKGDDKVSHGHSTFSIGTPEPWFHWEKTSEEFRSKTGGNSTMHSSSGFDIFTRSFGAGILSLLVVSLLGRIRRAEKPANEGAPPQSL